jgi:3-hydroxyacyl-CoA dehydrogenase/enoyl-CoA hydratase/3-hydroxybutyryl-CoA epimerase
MHYFSPVPKMPLLEIIITKQTSEWVTATAVDVGIKQGKTVIVVNDGPGFYTTRILAPFLNETLTILEEGGEIEQIDRAMKFFGFPVGPITLLDEVGIDVGAHVSGGVLTDLFQKRGITSTSKKILDELFKSGYKGRKNKKGFYIYDEKSGKKKGINSEIYNFFGGKNRKKFDTEEIQNRISLVMVNEAMFCLQENILTSPRDGDMGAILGLGFPPFLGGPFRYTDKISSQKLTFMLRKLEDKYGARFTPAQILVDKTSRNEGFYRNS